MLDVPGGDSVKNLLRGNLLINARQISWEASWKQDNVDRNMYSIMKNMVAYCIKAEFKGPIFYLIISITSQLLTPQALQISL